MCGRASGALFQEARVPLEEEDVVEEVERERPEVEERGYEAPVLPCCQYRNFIPSAWGANLVPKEYGADTVE